MKAAVRLILAFLMILSAFGCAEGNDPFSNTTDGDRDMADNEESEMDAMEVDIPADYDNDTETDGDIETDLWYPIGKLKIVLI